MNKLLFLSNGIYSYLSKLKWLFLPGEMAINGWKSEVVISGEDSFLYKLAKENEKLIKECNISLFIPDIYGIDVTKKRATLFRALESMEGLYIPGTGIELWKLILLDDLAGTFRNFYYSFPADGVSIIIVPLTEWHMQDEFSAYYHLQLFKFARERDIPIVGFEAQRLSPDIYYHYLFCDFYLLQDEKSQGLVISKFGISADKTYVLRNRYRNILSESVMSFKSTILLMNDFNKLKEIYKAPNPVVGIVHSIQERYAFRLALRTLSELKEPFNLIVFTHPSSETIGMKEFEVVQKAYNDEFKRYDAFNNKTILTYDTPRISSEELSMLCDILIIVDSADGANSLLSSTDSLIYFNPFHPSPYIKNSLSSPQELLKKVRNLLKINFQKRTFFSAIDEISSRKVRENEYSKR